MKQLALCKNCSLQFDVTNIQTGSRFRCHCGSVIEVTAQKPHNSATLHCSACGGVRKNQDDTCTYCSGQFTLHEKDLAGSCPQCFTKTSAKAAYCHGCGLMLGEGLPAGTPTKDLCPACQLPAHPMSARTFPEQGVSLLECNTCAGVWVSRKTFDHLCRSTFKTSFKHLRLAQSTRSTKEGPQKRFYRVCPVCKDVLNRVLYNKKSGVVIDVCTQDGIWFDMNELQAVLNYEVQTNSAVRTHRTNTETATTVEPTTQVTEDSPSEQNDVYVIDEDIDLDDVVKSLFGRTKS